MTETNEPGAELIAEADAATERLKAVKDSIGRVIYGLEDEIELCLAAILAGGHTLLTNLIPYHLLIIVPRD